MAGLAGITLLPAIDAFAGAPIATDDNSREVFKLRFAIVSDGHYGQPNTESDKFFDDMVSWMQAQYKSNQLDLVIANGDLVHDRPDLLPKIKSEYFDKIGVPVYAVPGNHDHADAALWKKVFGYDDNYVVEKGDIGIVFANTSNVKGEFICPDLAFLKSSFEKFKHKEVVFVILHIPPHIWLPEEKAAFAECPEVIALLHQYPNIKAAFHGHDHTLDGVRYTGKFPHFFDAHFGGDWGTSYKGYRIVEVNMNNSINTYQVNATMNPQINRMKL
ncbi:hypothetical protein GCM10028827_17290 [Mucilaginibacter myungsuensis]